MPIYTRSNLYDDVSHNASSVTNADRLVNRAIREVISDVDVRSTKRRSYLSPVLHDEQFDYQAPSDLKEWAIIDMARVEGRERRDKFNMVTTEYFDRYKDDNKNLIAIQDRDFLKKLRVSAELNSDTNQAVLHQCDSLNDDGSWVATGDANGLALDSDIMANGSASLNFDIDASYTSGLLTNTTSSTNVMAGVDISDYKEQGSVFFYMWIPNTTGLTSFKLRVGSSSSAYWEQNVTVTNENLAFQTGWNLLRLDFQSATKTSAPDMDNIDYLRLEVVGDGTASATTNWRLDYVVARRGVQHAVWYYTRFGWQSSTGTYLENSTANTDLINCDTEEYDLYITKAREIFAEELKKYDNADRFRKRFEQKKLSYQSHYPSERMLVIQDNHSFRQDLTEESWLGNQ